MESNRTNHRPIMLADTLGKDTLNKIMFLLKGLQYCEPISGNLLLRIVEKIDINSNTVLI
jgi:hypothetical protein